MNAAATIHDARLQAGLTQTQLAQRAGTSQATISAYEAGRKQPTVATMSRLLSAAGSRLTAEPAGYRVVRPSAAEFAQRGRILHDVLDLAESLPFRRSRDLAYPHLVR